MQSKFNEIIKGYSKKKLLENDKYGFTKEERVLLDTFKTVILLDEKVPLNVSLGEYEEERVITLQRGNKAYVLHE